MSTPPPEPSDKPSAGEQAKDDLKNSAAGIITSTAQGAASGGGVGAALGALKGIGTAALKTKTGRKGIAIVILTPVVVIAMVAIMIFGGSGTSSNAGNAMNSVQEAATQAVALKDTGNKEDLELITTNAYRTDVRWEVLAAIYVDTKDRSAHNGKGPMGIDPKLAKDLSDEGIEDLDQSSFYLGKALSAASADKLYALENFDLDAGYVDLASDEDESNTRAEIDTDEAKALRDSVRDTYIEVLKTLPLEANPDAAEKIFDMARQWALGKPANKSDMCGDSGGKFDVGDTEIALNAEQKKNAQEIINAVAARKMSEKAAVIALATAMTESTLINVNYGDEATWTNPDGSPTSSVGLFQQQKWWGSREDRMNPTKATGFFLDALVKVPGWARMSVTDAAQTVQSSAYPEAYAKWEAQSIQLVKDMPPTGGGSFTHPEEDNHESSSDSSIDALRGVDLPDVPNPNNLKVNTVGTIGNIQAAEKIMIQKFGTKLHAMYDTGGGGEHAEGRAVDLMLTNYQSAAGKAVGDQISKFFIDNEAAFNVEYIIFNDKIWLGKIVGWDQYSGKYGGMYNGNWNDTTLHKDHVHVTFRVAPGTGGDLVYRSPDGTSSECGGTTGMGTGASGKGDDYPYRNPAGDCAWCAGSADPGADPWALYKRECVSFVAWRMNQQMGWKEGQEYPFTMAKMNLAGRGNASYWKDGLTSKGYIADMNPAVGAIAWWTGFTTKPGFVTGEAGHVAVVKEVLPDGKVVIEQYNAVPHEYSTQTIPKENVDAYIHVADVK